MLPIGQALWLKELETYRRIPPLQDPASYNLDQVMEQIKKAKLPVAAIVASVAGRDYIIRKAAGTKAGRLL